MVVFRPRRLSSPPRSAHQAQLTVRSRAYSCAMVRPSEMRGSQLIGLNLLALLRSRLPGRHNTLALALGHARLTRRW